MIGTNATIRLSQSSLTANVAGYSAPGGGVILNDGDNNINNNNTGTLDTASKQ